MFKEGETVRHKTGGPEMAVALICRDGSDVSYNCSWFDGDVRKIETFSAGELVRVQSNPIASNDDGESYDPLAGYR